MYFIRTYFIKNVLFRVFHSLLSQSAIEDSLPVLENVYLMHVKIYLRLSDNHSLLSDKLKS